MAIDIGAEAINRGTTTSEAFTYIDKTNPANASGIINTIEIWAYSALSNCVVGTFYVISGNTLRCRDSVVIGSVAKGSKQTFSGLSIAVEAGDYIGFYAPSGRVERDSSGYAGNWRLSGEYINPGDEATYGLLDDDGFSVYGTGDGVVAYYHGLKVQGVGELALCDVGNHPLRIRKGGTTYGLELVDTSDPNASKIRIKTGVGIKAIRKYT